MNGIAFGYPWKYRLETDELVVMTSDQVFKLKSYRPAGRPKTFDETKCLVEQRILEDVHTIRAKETRLRGHLTSQVVIDEEHR